MKTTKLEAIIWCKEHQLGFRNKYITDGIEWCLTEDELVEFYKVHDSIVPITHEFINSEWNEYSLCHSQNIRQWWLVWIRRFQN